MSVEMLLSVLLRIVLALEKIKLERLFFYMLLDCQKGTLCIRVELLTLILLLMCLIRVNVG